MLSHTFVSNIAPPLHASKQRRNSNVASLPLTSRPSAAGLGSTGEKFL
jgi:hypothetical protein